MDALLFLIAVSAFLYFSFRAGRAALHKRPVRAHLCNMLEVPAAYFLIWLVFYLKKAEYPEKLGAPLCFDDWCASVTDYKFQDKPGGGKYLFLYMEISNRAKRVAMRPSEPRVYVRDAQNRQYRPSAEALRFFEQQHGPQQSSVDTLLQPGEAQFPMLAFEIPATATGLSAVIEEGPVWVNKLFLQFDQPVFELH